MDGKQSAKRRKHKARTADLRDQIENMLAAFKRGNITGTPVEDTSTLKEIEEASWRSLTQRYNPETTWTDGQGNHWTRGVGGAVVPAHPDLLEHSDIDADERQQRRISKASQRAYAAFKISHPGFEQADISAALGHVATEHGLTTSDLLSIADDESSRDLLFDEIARAANLGLAYPNSQAPDDNRTGGLSYAGRPATNGRGTRDAEKDEEESGSLSGDIAAWQKQTGYRS